MIIDYIYHQYLQNISRICKDCSGTGSPSYPETWQKKLINPDLSWVPELDKASKHSASVYSCEKMWGMQKEGQIDEEVKKKRDNNIGYNANNAEIIQVIGKKDK